MKYSKYLWLLLAGMPVTVGAQQIRSDYVDKGVNGTEFPAALKNWEKGQKWSEDDNFFISRVKPHKRFRNTATQVNPNLNEENDKKLIFWVPINNEEFNALPDGVFDSEVFPMWSYVTHYGNWSSRLVRVPAGFLDVAHKNGVPVSALASIPYGNITAAWRNALTQLTEVGPEKLSDYLLYYGVDGIGYNSEFSGSATLVSGLTDLHEKTVKLMEAAGGIPEFIWYDGTNSNGYISFDRGLADHNKEIWGYGDAIRSSLFFNYNWNNTSLLSKTVSNAKAYGRSPLDLYCGINMQGREPHNGGAIWTLMQQYPVSIGLWGAHSENMFFESRAEQGSSALQHQRTYLNRMMNWFTNGSHNPIASHSFSNSLVYSAENTDFFGMSKMMSARSALSWNLDDEPFITYFNLGNGFFFNWDGERSHNSEWYNIASQDYLPTWMWWMSSRFLGRESSDIVKNGLKAEYVWDDAWVGGSTIRVHGSSPEEYMHLFKTEFPVKTGDELTFRYKLLSGSADGFIAMSLKGSEANPVAEEKLRWLDSKSGSIPGVWVEKKFTVGTDIPVADGSEISMIALHFKNASDVDMRFGELSIKRPSAMSNTVSAPVVESTKLFSARHDGVDGKIIFNMPNDKTDGVCYNLDVNTSFFKLYSQQKGAEPVLMGTTTSWAGLMFSAPYTGELGNEVRFGVSALALNHESESEISWGEWHDASAVYAISDDIALSKNVIKPYESFSISYIDGTHEAADWKLTDSKGNVVAEAKDTKSCVVKDGIAAPGIYDLAIKGIEGNESGRTEITRLLKGYIQITGDETGDIPYFTSVTVQDAEAVEAGSSDDVAEFKLNTREPVIDYDIHPGSAVMSRGVQIGEKAFGFQIDKTEIAQYGSFGVSFWFKPDGFDHKSVHALNIRDKGDAWAVNNWGWFWHTFTEDGRSAEFTIRMSSGNNASYRFDGLRLIPGAWYHIGYSFEFDDKRSVKPALYINGEKQEITSWSLGDQQQSGEVDFAGPVKRWNTASVVALGGYLHKTGSVRGNADNFMVWNRSFTEADMVAAMGDTKPETLPEGVIGYFDFEVDAAQDGLFENRGRRNFEAGMHGYKDTEVEGQGTLEWAKPEYCSGCPFTTGSAFELKTTVGCEAPGAKVLENADGHVRLSYPASLPASEPCFVRLNASNEYGSDQRDMILYLGESGVRTVLESGAGLKVFPQVFESEINVVSPVSGRITLALYSLDGKCVLSNIFNAEADNTLKIYPNVPSGIYLLKVEKDGHAVGSARLLRR